VELVSHRRAFQLLLLTFAAAAGMYARTAFSPLQETMRTALALSDNEMALLQGPALALAFVIGTIPLGIAVDRYLRVRLLLIFAAANVVGTVLTALSSNFTLLFLARSLIGLTNAASSVVAVSLIADLYPPAQRGRAIMVVVMGIHGGASIAFALGGSLIALPDAGPNGWRWAMLWLTVPLILVVFALLALREPPRTSVAVANPSVRDTFGELWRYRAVLVPLLSGIVLAEVGLQAVLIWAAPALSRRFTLPPDHIGSIMATGLMVSGLVGPIAGGILADFCQRTGGPRRTISVLSGLALLSAPAGLFAIVPEVAVASALLALFMTIIGVLLVMSPTLVTIVVPNEVRGLCVSAMSAGNVFFGIALAPVAVSLLSGALGGPSTIGTSLALVGVTACGLASVTFAIGTRRFPRTAI